MSGRRDNSDELSVFVHLPWPSAEPILCGVLTYRGQKTTFAYAQQWLNHPEHFALAPDLPLNMGEHHPPMGGAMHSIFEDAGPDKWAKSVMNRLYEIRRKTPFDYLHFVGGNAIGALSFSSSSVAEINELDGFTSDELPALLRSAQNIHNHEPVDANLRRLLMPGSSAGGAQPKVIVKHHGEDWLAKFPLPGIERDFCAMENQSLTLAERCGIHVPAHETLQVGEHTVILIRRFDRPAGGGRIHQASAKTILLSQGIPVDAMGYSDMADFIRANSANPSASCEELFRRMVLNIVIDNTDDHEKNHAFQWLGGKWELSPVYDIHPQCQNIGYQQLRVGADGHDATLENAISECERFLLTKVKSRQVIDEIVSQASRLR